MKKILIILFAMVSVFSCGKKNNNITPENSPSETAVDNQDITITLAVIDNMSKTEKKMQEVTDFNVEIKKYDWSYGDDAFEMLSLDMISGDCPDVIYFPTEYIKTLIKRGYMTDMYPLLDNSENLSREDFLPNVLKGLDDDGKLPAML